MFKFGWPGPLLLTWIKKITPAWITDYIHCEVWDEINNPFPNFNRATVEVGNGIGNFIPYFPGHVITFPCWDWSQTMFAKGDPGPCLTTEIWRCRKPFSQWQRSFQRNLHSLWLKFLRQRRVAVVRQGPDDRTSTSTELTQISHYDNMRHRNDFRVDGLFEGNHWWFPWQRGINTELLSVRCG